jgi:hypothetical protein
MPISGKYIFGEQVTYKTKVGQNTIEQFNEICNDLRSCDTCMHDTINIFNASKKRSTITKYADICKISTNKMFIPLTKQTQQMLEGYFESNFFKRLNVGDYYFLECIYTENGYLYNPFRFRLTATDTINLYQPAATCYLNGFGFLNNLSDYPMVYIQITNDLSKDELAEIDETLERARKSVASKLTVNKK